MTVNIEVMTRDTYIWNERNVIENIVFAMLKQEDLRINFMSEGFCFVESGFLPLLNSLADKYHYDTSRITLLSANPLNVAAGINHVYTGMMQHWHLARKFTAVSKNICKHVGMFVAKPNAPRLYIASQLHKNYNPSLTMTYHFNSDEEVYQANVSLNEVVHNFGISAAKDAAKFLTKCPILDHKNTITLKADSKLNIAQQLANVDLIEFQNLYKSFFVEVVCESYYSGNTFFVTEKTWRPIVMRTPFLIQGPQNFIRRLNDIGFMTFSKYWDEGYNEDPALSQPDQILDIIKWLSNQPITRLDTMYQDMQQVFNHNIEVFNNLTEEDILKIQ